MARWAGGWLVIRTRSACRRAAYIRLGWRLRHLRPEIRRRELRAARGNSPVAAVILRIGILGIARAGYQSGGYEGIEGWMGLHGTRLQASSIPASGAASAKRRIRMGDPSTSRSEMRRKGPRVVEKTMINLKFKAGCGHWLTPDSSHFTQRLLLARDFPYSKKKAFFLTIQRSPPTPLS
mgnify:CR=1 FL=1